MYTAIIIILLECEEFSGHLNTSLTVPVSVPVDSKVGTSQRYTYSVVCEDPASITAPYCVGAKVTQYHRTYRKYNDKKTVSRCVENNELLCQQIKYMCNVSLV